MCQSNSDRATRHCRIITSADYCIIYGVPWPYKVHYTNSKFHYFELYRSPSRKNFNLSWGSPMWMIAVPSNIDTEIKQAQLKFLKSDMAFLLIFLLTLQVLSRSSDKFVRSCRITEDLSSSVSREIIFCAIALISDVINLNSVPVMAIKKFFREHLCSKFVFVIVRNWINLIFVSWCRLWQAIQIKSILFNCNYYF